MSATVQSPGATSVRRVALFACVALLSFLIVGSAALWATYGGDVFFEIVAAGIAYCL